MQEIFLKILSMGMNASWMILAVLLWRIIFWKSPKWITCFLWMLVGIRLLCPWNIESAASFVPVQIESSSHYSKQDMDGENQKLTDIQKDHVSAVNETEQSVKNVSESSKKKQNGNSSLVQTKHPFIGTMNRQIMLSNTIIKGTMIVWILGVVGILSYFLASFIYVYKKVETATLLRENIWQSEFVDTPFIFGCIRPKIYIPYGMGQEQLFYSLAHEHAHLKRKDHITKFIAFLVLALYWFQPLVWVAYVYMSKDMELACDEKTVADMNQEERKKYLLTLLSCSVGKKKANVYPLAFGEIGIKERVIRMKKWKKPSFFIRTGILLAGLVVAVCFFTNPKGQKINLVNAQEETKQEAGKDAKILQVKEASVNLEQSTGADGVMLYYNDENKIIFGGYFGLFVYDKAAHKITQSLDLEYIGCNATQGDDYCEIIADQDGKKVFLTLARQKKRYEWDLESNQLQLKNNSNSKADLSNTGSTKEFVYYNDKNEKIIGTLEEKDFTIGNCVYREDKIDEAGNKEKIEEYKLFDNYK